MLSKPPFHSTHRKTMPHIVLPPRWQARENDVTSEHTYRNRRQFIEELGLGTVGMAVLGTMGCSMTSFGPLDTIPGNAPREGYPATRNEAFSVPEREVTGRIFASSYNNFYEFDGTSKEVWHLTERYEPFPMTIRVRGLVEKRLTFDVAELIRTMGPRRTPVPLPVRRGLGHDGAMDGVPAQQNSSSGANRSPRATHVRFVSVNRPGQMEGIRKQPWYPWPYYEALRMDEAMNELAFVVTGMYGEPLPKQNGSPLRLALPWKYGYKGPKAIVRIEFTDEQPGTFWNDFVPDEYGFLSNINPNIPHPRWSPGHGNVAGNRRACTHSNFQWIRRVGIRTVPGRTPHSRQTLSAVTRRLLPDPPSCAGIDSRRIRPRKAACIQRGQLRRLYLQDATGHDRSLRSPLLAMVPRTETRPANRFPQAPAQT